MKKSMSTLFSMVMIGMGFLSIIWASTSMLGKAHSQQPANPAGKQAAPANPADPNLRKNNAAQPPAPGAPAAPGSPAAAAPSAPTMDIPPTSGEVAPPASDAPILGTPNSQTEAFVPGFQNPEGYAYDPSGRRDPFRPFGQSQFAGKIPGPIQIPTQMGVTPMAPPVQSGPAEPLQQYDLAQLKVVGIVWEVRSPKAMVRDPLGKLHLIVRDSKIGRNNGFVAAIREGEVIVVEPAVGEGGMQTANTRVMVLVR